MLLHLIVSVTLFAAQDTKMSPEQQLRAESALQAVFSRDFDPMPMSELIEILSKETGVGMSASNRAADDMVLLFVREKSYAEVLLELARHFGFTWEIQHVGKTKHYLLTQTSAAAAEEAKGRDRFQLERIEKIKADARKDANITAEQIEQRKAKLFEWYRRQPKEPDTGPEEDSNWYRSPEWLTYQSWLGSDEAEDQERLKPDRLAVAKFVASLSDDVWLRLARGETISYHTSPRTYQSRLSNSWLKDVRAWSEGADKPRPDGQDPMGPETRAARAVLPSVYCTRLGREDPTLPITSVGLVFQIEEPSVNLFGAGLVTNLRVALSAYDPARRPIRFAAYQFGVPMRWAEAEREAPSPRKDYSEDSVLGRYVTVPKVFSALGSPDEGERREAMRQYTRDMHEKGPLAPSVAQIRKAIADATGHSLICDAYQELLIASLVRSTSRLIPEKLRAGELLDILEQKDGQTWRIEDGWIEMRTKDWQFQRSSTAPPWLVRKLMDFAGGERPTLDDLAALAARLTPAQCRGLIPLQRYEVFAGSVGANSLIGQRALHTLRLWAELSTAQRDTLLSRGPVPYETLSPGARKALEALVQLEPIGMSGGFAEFGYPFEWDKADRIPMGRPYGVIFDWTEYLPPLPQRFVYLAARTNATPSYYVRLVADDGSVAFAMEPPPSGAKRMLRSYSKTSRDMEAMGTTYRFGKFFCDSLIVSVHLGNDTTVTAAARTSRKAEGEEFTGDALPDEVKRFSAETESSGDR
ncbi:MAG: hypothetical protein HRF45_07685 [Fimbriimonadia bacterium]|jgi:hypothetical protein